MTWCLYLRARLHTVSRCRLHPRVCLSWVCTRLYLNGSPFASKIGPSARVLISISSITEIYGLFDAIHEERIWRDVSRVCPRILLAANPIDRSRVQSKTRGYGERDDTLHFARYIICCYSIYSHRSLKLSANSRNKRISAVAWLILFYKLDNCKLRCTRCKNPSCNFS